MAVFLCKNRAIIVRVKILSLCYTIIKEVDIMFNICKYIKNNERLKELDFLTVYLTIVELIKDKKMEWNDNV